jgi:hypothetical protein
MTKRVEECRERAQHCERAGSLAVTLEARLMYADLAERWQKLAEQIGMLGTTDRLKHYAAPALVMLNHYQEERSVSVPPREGGGRRFESRHADHSGHVSCSK